MQVESKFTRKVISQIITVYQWVLSIELEDVWIGLMIKPNKNVDDMLDAINNELIKVCWEYLEGKKLWLDKYQLATICAELTTLAMERCEEPFWISVKTSKQLIQEYLEKNAKKRETLERIKKENETLDEKLAAQEKLKKEKRVALIEKVEIDMKPEMPSGNLEAGPMGANAPSPKPKKKRVRGTDALAITDFRLPRW